MTTTKSYDNLNRLTAITSQPSAGNAVSFGYQYNDANQRTKRTDSDASYWDYGYDSLGQVNSGHRKWSDNTSVAGQQYDYNFDDIGNRKTATLNSHVGTYVVVEVWDKCCKGVIGYKRIDFAPAIGWINFTLLVASGGALATVR